jgi:hypothetical protein
MFFRSVNGSKNRSKRRSDKTLENLRCITLRIALRAAVDGRQANAKALVESLDRDSRHWLVRTVEDWGRFLSIDGEVFVSKANFKVGNPRIDAIRSSPDYIHVTLEEWESDKHAVEKKLASA